MTREEAINEIKSWAIPSKKGREVLETLIPELRENEDENLKNKSGYYKADKFWKASTLWNATKNKVPQRVPNRYILQECTWNIGTLQQFVDEVKNVQEVSLDYPIILDMNGNIIDGAHRVVKAYLEGKDIDIVYIGDDEWPEPDYDEEKAIKESDDERIINQLITLVNINSAAGEVLLIPTNKEELVAWLNKCKESLHIPETCKENADSFTEDERIRQWLYDLVDEGAYLCERPCATESILAYLEKQKQAQTDDEKEYIRTIKSIISDFIRDKKPEDVVFYQKIYDWLDERHIEQEPNIELIQRSWYIKGYHDREFGKEPKWIIKTGEGGPRHEENPKYGQMLEAEQKPAEQLGGTFTSYDMAKTFTEGQNYVVAHPEKFGLYKPAEWSEGDEEMMADIIDSLEYAYPYDNEFRIAWLKSLHPQPHWKPSKKQIYSLGTVVNGYDNCTVGSIGYNLKELYEQLKKLM